jgi:hypothetical protein
MKDIRYYVVKLLTPKGKVVEYWEVRNPQDRSWVFELHDAARLGIPIS